MNKKVAVITSTDVQFDRMLQTVEVKSIVNKYIRAEYMVGSINKIEVYIFNRSSIGNLSAPHEVNYRGYLTAIKQLNINCIYATSIVGSLNPKIYAGSLVVLDQFLDFTKKRELTIFDDSYYKFTDFTHPYCKRLRRTLIKSAKLFEKNIFSNGCYVGVDGPRYETAAEVKMYSLLGGDVIGMSNLPEVIFARELGICYSSIAYVANLGAGLSPIPITIEDINYQTQSFQKTITNILYDSITNTKFTSCSCCIKTKMLPRYKM